MADEEEMKNCLFILLVFSSEALKAEIVFNASDTSHPFYGFGAQIWPGDSRVETLFTNLHLKYLRMCPGGCLNPPTDVNQAQMDAYVNSEYNGTTRGNNIIASLQMAANHDVNVIFIKFGCVPSSWLTTGNQLKSGNFDDFARVWASEVLFFKSRGLRVNYIELFNEPEGDWNVYCPGADYNTVVKLVRAELNSRGLNDVGIIGPGLAYLYYGPDWISALDSDGKNALAAWSTHAWDEGWGHTDALPSFLDQRWKNYFGAAVNSADPCHNKQIIVTEYATGVRTFNGVTFGADVVVDSNQFAERCYENSLTLANNGANVLCFWEAADQSWESAPLWGLMRQPSQGSTLRPVYYALSTLAPYIPDNAMVLTKTWDDNEISAAGFTDGNQLVLAFANSGPNTVSRTVQITGVANFSITSANAFIAGAVVNKLSEVNYVSGQLAVSLPRESTLTVTGSVSECNALLASDLNGDCKVTLADFAIVASDWMKDNRTYAQTQTVDNFQSYADSNALNAVWAVNNSGNTMTETLVNEGSNKVMKLLYNVQSPYWCQTKYTFPGAVLSLHGVDLTQYTDMNLKIKVTDIGGWDYFQAFDCGGNSILKVHFGSSAPTAVTNGWVNWHIDISSMTRNNVYQFTFGADSTWFDSPTGDLWLDDITLSAGSSGCSGAITGDINQDCVVDFKDIEELSQNWLECSLVEQLECL